MGKVIMSGIVPKLTAPTTYIPISDLAVGTIVKLKVDGELVDFIVVNQGIPSNSSLYDSSCNGTWLLAKTIAGEEKMNSTAKNSYSATSMHSTILNVTYLGRLDAKVQSAIKQVRIPYVNNTGTKGSVASGASGLSTKIFLLSWYEINNEQIVPIKCDGAFLEYFRGMSNSERAKEGNYEWYVTRTPDAGDDEYFIALNGVQGNSAYRAGNTTVAYRPAMIMYSNTMVDPETMEVVVA